MFFLKVLANTYIRKYILASLWLEANTLIKYRFSRFVT